MSGKLGVVFPGQGTQKPGMGEPWRGTRSWPVVGEISEWTGIDVTHLLLTADEAELRRTDRAQLAIFTMGVLVFSEASRIGLLGGDGGDRGSGSTVTAFAGHSLGEYVALTAAGALPVRAAAGLVAERGAAMLTAATERPGTMAALIGADAASAEALTARCRDDGFEVWVANQNAPGQVVASGTVDGIEHANGIAGDFGLKVIRLEVGGAFHSPLMSSAADRLKKVLQDVPFASSHATVVANVDAAPHTAGDVWPSLLAEQLTGPVRWEESVRTLIALGCDRLIEVGPGKTLAGMAKRISRETPVVSANSPEVLAALAEQRP